MPYPHIYTAAVKKEALAQGFDYCGIARAVPLEEDARRLESWLRAGRHGSMQYMENYFDLRVDPARLVPGARSVITVLKIISRSRNCLAR
jgi:epoxyqueuosine reductase